MFSQRPKSYRIALRTTLATSWGFIAVSGFAGAFIPARTVLEAASYNWVIHASGYVTLIAALAAFIGVAVGGRLWWLEWVGAGFVAAGLIHYVVVPWSFLIQGEYGRLQQASVVTACFIGIVTHRLIACATHARKLRRQYEVDIEIIESVIDDR